MPVILQNDHSEGDDKAVGGAAGDHIHLMFLERSIEQSQIHDARFAREFEAVGTRQSTIAVGTFHEFITEAGAPLGAMRRHVRDGAQPEALCILAANHDGEGIVESERRANLKSEAIAVAVSNGTVDRVSVIRGTLSEDGLEGRSGIFGVQIHLTGQQCLVTDQRATQVEPAIDLQGRMHFDLLGQQLIARMICSVKFLEPVTTVLERPRRQPASVAKAPPSKLRASRLVRRIATFRRP